MCALYEGKITDIMQREKRYNEFTENGKRKAGGQIAQSEGGEVGKLKAAD